MATVLVDNGKKAIIAALNTADPKHVGWGTGAGTSGETDTTLFTEAAEDRVAGTKSIVTTVKADDTYQVVATMTSESEQTVTNAGLFAGEAGDLIVKGDFTGVPLAIGDKIEFTIKIQQTNG